MLSYPFVSEKYTHDIVTLVTAKEWLRMDIDGYDREDDAILEAIAGAVKRVETTCNLQLGVSEFTWNTNCLPRVFADTFYIKEIVSIEYLGETDYQLIPADQYKLRRVSERRSIIVWKPVVPILGSDDIRIKFKAGFEENEAPADLIKAIRAMVIEEFDGRGDSVSEKKTFSDKLMAPYQIGYAG